MQGSGVCSNIHEADNPHGAHPSAFKRISNGASSALLGAFRHRNSASLKASNVGLASECRFTFAEVFAGIGGFRLALERAGGECVFVSEYCKFARNTYRQNWPADSEEMIVGDVRRIMPSQIPTHDVLAAGFPCQDFSNVGTKHGLDGARGSLFYELVRLIAGCRPRALLLENVRGLLTQPELMRTVVSQLSALGYRVSHHEYDAALLLPQRRRRVYIVGFLHAQAALSFEWPVLPAMRRSADEVLEADAPAHLTLSDAKWQRVSSSSYFSRFPAARLLRNGALAQTLQERPGTQPSVSHLTTYKSGYLLYSQFVAQCGANPRFYTPRECASFPGTADAKFACAVTQTMLMGFPANFQLSHDEGHAYRQLGNAVCPPIVSPIAHAIVQALMAKDGFALPPMERACIQLRGAIELTLEAMSPRRILEVVWLPTDVVAALRLQPLKYFPSANTEADLEGHGAALQEEGIFADRRAVSVATFTSVSAELLKTWQQGVEPIAAEQDTQECVHHSQTLPLPSAETKRYIAQSLRAFRLRCTDVQDRNSRILFEGYHHDFSP